jgi:nicotinate-nucleotide--dimethylbenzimidazole phosphoribosyltransferase
MAVELPAISPISDAALTARLQHRLDQLTKPQGSLGRLEQLALQIGLIQRSISPQFEDPQVLVFAGDHGLTAQGVSAYPSDVTWQMVENFCAGGAAVSVLARQHGLALTVVDAGVNHTFVPRAGLRLHKIAAGTADASLTSAMTTDQCTEALLTGMAIVASLPGNVVLLGEMGIGNTSSAALLLSRLARLPIEDCVGRGTGLDDKGLAHKLDVLRRVMERHSLAQSPLEVLAAMGGFEIAMMVGAALKAASERRVVMVDGFISGSAILVASALIPAVLDYCVFAHQSSERAHHVMLDHMGGKPLLNLELRLGEGSGAVLAWPLVQSALHLLNGMASFDAAGVSKREAS